MGPSIDLAILDSFGFEYKPVGVKFSLTKPKGIPKLEKKLAFCEMLKEAQGSDTSFYTTKDNHECKAGPILLGMCEPDPIFESGQVGPMLGVYDDPRANRKLYMNMHRMERDTINYVLYAPLDKLCFDPDMLIVTARPQQAEILLRAYSYRTGAAWNAKGTTVVGCTYLYMYPYASGEINIMITGLHHGMKARQLFPDGLLFITIPYNLLPEIVTNLKNIQWDLPQYSWGKARHLERMKEIAAKVKADLEQ
jgi:uncharacterized protein (DUF169 family)